MTGLNEAALLSRFLRGELDNRDFRHRDHLAVAFELLRLVPFPEAAALYVCGVKTIAARAGNPGAYHETITIAFLSLVAERAAEIGDVDFAAFIAANPDLHDKHILSRWYDAGRLGTDLARRQFVLPTPVSVQA